MYASTEITNKSDVDDARVMHALMGILPCIDSRGELLKALLPHVLLAGRSHKEAQEGSPSGVGHVPCFGGDGGESVSSFLHSDAPKGDDHRLVQIEVETRERSELFIGVKVLGKVSAAVIDDKSHIVGKCADAHVAVLCDTVEFPQKDVYH